MRIGLVGAAAIAPISVVNPAKDLEGVDVVGVAARDVERARSFAEEYGISRVHASYADLVADDSIDALYVGLPNSLHARWAIAGLEAGRHVLCEKPLSSNAVEAALMVETAERTGRWLIEAFHWRYHPVAARMLELSKNVGELVRIESRFDALITDRSNIRHDLGLAGGAMMDLGCYTLHFVRTVAGEEPEVKSATAIEGSPGIDLSMEAELAFPSGATASIGCSMTRSTRPFVHILGRDGWVHVENPMAPQNGHRITAQLSDSSIVDEELDLRPSYFFQLGSFAGVLAGTEQPLTGGTDAVANMTAIDAIYEASGLGARH
jgi:predicted dehydrogenase